MKNFKEILNESKSKFNYKYVDASNKWDKPDRNGNTIIGAVQNEQGYKICPVAKTKDGLFYAGNKLKSVLLAKTKEEAIEIFLKKNEKSLKKDYPDLFN